MSKTMDSSEVDSLLSEVISTTSHSSEVGEALLTDSITQSVDIRISPTVELISFDDDAAADTDEFSLVADVQVKMEDDVLTNGVVHLEDHPNGGKQDFQQEQQVGTLLHFEHVSVKDIKPTKNSKKWGAPPHSVESKIAQEIKEMKQREEDLRRMRELMAKEVATNGHAPKETVKSVKLKTEIDHPQPITKAVNGHQNYNPASVFGGVKRATPQKRAPQLQESPIEKEIRMVKEREEELRRERALRRGGEAMSDDQVSLCSDSSFDSKHLPSLDLYSYSTSAGSVCSLDSNGGKLLRSPSPDSWSSFQKPVNMERFIASKGKQVVFKKASSDYLMEIRPPQVKKGHQPHRKFVSAATKIQSELQEMKEREEELKKERLLGLNRQQLMSDRTPETKKDLNQTSTAICSRPDFLENDESHENEREVELVNQNRRRSSLIEEWERRIQKFGVQA